MWLLNRRKSSTDQQDSDIDITPMLDVVFIMLIFFIVTASFVKESGFGINKPSITGEESPTKSIVLEVSATDEIRIQKRLVSATSIKATIVRLLAENPNIGVVVRVHPKSKTKTMVGAIDQLRSANIELPSVSLIRS